MSKQITSFDLNDVRSQEIIAPDYWQPVVITYDLGALQLHAEVDDLSRGNISRTIKIYASREQHEDGHREIYLGTFTNGSNVQRFVYEQAEPV